MVSKIPIYHNRLISGIIDTHWNWEKIIFLLYKRLFKNYSLCWSPCSYCYTCINYDLLTVCDYEHDEKYNIHKARAEHDHRNWGICSPCMGHHFTIQPLVIILLWCSRDLVGGALIAARQLQYELYLGRRGESFWFAHTPLKTIAAVYRSYHLLFMF